MHKNRILLQGNFGNMGELTDECVNFIKSKGGKYPDILNCRHDPILIEMFDKFSEIPKFGPKILKTKNPHSYFYVKEISGDTYVIEEYDGCETAKTPNDFDWIKITN
ncbi:MAG: hypothetical protein [Wendovervirus sonii]|uniref:Uncharacterized protein n=1 Tax=phage Lak_Megaphage_Sonny TaxID=3109229 RepID=A0ABZ0Z725_9CAUD|nr:MAG: hypothetical protein [phage Lak_Megaphage_Sonny]